MAETQAGSVLVVVAHPDDELFVSGTLCLCADKGFEITLVCLTDGEGAVAASGPAGRRRGELERSALNLGVKKVVFLGFPDVGAPSVTNDPVWDEQRLARQLGAIILDEKPALILTHGPRGGYGHPAHRWAHQGAMAAAEATAYPGSLFSFCGRVPQAFFSWHFEGESAVLIDARPFLARRAASLDFHQSQIDFFVQPHRPRSLRKLMSAMFGYLFVWTEAGRKRSPIGTARRFFERFPVEGLMVQRAPRERSHFFAEHFADDPRVTIAR
ncbi:MAG TPA: PIG-L family deacetylase [Caulobacteraceae bacterium]|nr:PIG-L family deacetylase [Caulobacteraceae bacterium]